MPSEPPGVAASPRGYEFPGQGRLQEKRTRAVQGEVEAVLLHDPFVVTRIGGGAEERADDAAALRPRHQRHGMRRAGEAGVIGAHEALAQLREQAEFEMASMERGRDREIVVSGFFNAKHGCILPSPLGWRLKWLIAESRRSFHGNGPGRTFSWRSRGPDG